MSAFGPQNISVATLQSQTLILTKQQTDTQSTDMPGISVSNELVDNGFTPAATLTFQ